VDVADVVAVSSHQNATARGLVYEATFPAKCPRTLRNSLQCLYCAHDKAITPCTESKAMPSGRISDYTPELVEKAWHYADGGWQEVGDLVPSVAGLACEIGVSRETCYAWAKDETKVFSDILSVIAKSQERQLLRGGLSSAFNASITKMILTKHGYSDRVETDHTSSDGSMTPQTVERVIVKAENTDR
jgi:hypothetical protein